MVLLYATVRVKRKQDLCININTFTPTMPNSSNMYPRQTQSLLAQNIIPLHTHHQTHAFTTHTSSIHLHSLYTLQLILFFSHHCIFTQTQHIQFCFYKYIHLFQPLAWSSFTSHPLHSTFIHASPCLQDPQSSLFFFLSFSLYEEMDWKERNINTFSLYPITTSLHHIRKHSNGIAISQQHLHDNTFYFKPRSKYKKSTIQSCDQSKTRTPNTKAFSQHFDRKEGRY